VSDIDTAVAHSLKVFDPERPIREAEVDVACTKHEIDRQQTSRFTEVDQIVRMVISSGPIRTGEKSA
jgi:hypothetical protein